MQVLFAITIVSFFLLLWAAFAITRRIRASQQLKRSSLAQPDFRRDESDATESTSSQSHSVQQQKSKSSAQHIGWKISPTRPHQNI
jgi:hypothetical protein